ncbi:hypothetical protein [Aquirhabdus parva]|uniref:Transcriptional regulator SutA RNAP-binding domain-containing protein n=1 Tax=Aquirhabdus parva TaxID=2283318 RepID=A0A345P588_9GAMM|nr:hypothetical protein [Aquirhabdus parva]AXI02447.1 hypothetical protein HYN46_06155 [Aquirhabdus parva]
MSSTEYSDDYEGVDPSDETADDDGIDDVDAVVASDDGDVDAAAGASKGDGEGRPAPDDVAQAESLSPSAKRDERQRLAEELERFLAQGGRIQEVPADESIRD